MFMVMRRPSGSMPQPHSLAGMCGFFSDLTMLAALVLLAFISAEAQREA